VAFFQQKQIKCCPEHISDFLIDNSKEGQKQKGYGAKKALNYMSPATDSLIMAKQPTLTFSSWSRLPQL